MISQSEIFAALYGALRLARGDPNGVHYFNATLEGFWRSFTAAALIAPLFAVLLWVRYDTGTMTVAPARFILIEALSYVIAWTVFPLIMFYLVQVIERERRFIGFIVAYNWAAVWQNLVFIPISIAGELGWLPAQAASALSLAVLVAVFVYTWFIARTALAIAILPAAGVVALDFLVAILLNMVTDGLLRAGG